MKILIFNWRSIKDPLEGGAERATFEFAKRWVKNHNAEVFWVSPTYNKNIKSEIIEGVKFDYIGLPLNRNVFALLITFPLFYFLLYFNYLKKYKGKIDVLIDQVHGIPFLTPLYVKEKIFVYIHEVAGEIWNIMYPFPINILGRITEKLIFSIYKNLNINFIANSDSTFNDLIKVLKIKEENIKIILYGVSAPKTSFEELPKKEQELTVVYLNRIVKMKGIERGLEVFRLINNEFPNSKLWIIGRGEEDYVKFLKELVKNKKLESNVKFLGFKDGQEKFNLLGRAHVLINPSYLEGFGLVNIEANRMGTPAAVFDVRGCRDSVKNNENGLISKDNNVEEMSKNIIKLYNSNEIQKKSWDYSNKFDWDIQAEKFFSKISS